jgi:hypothetical protein
MNIKRSLDSRIRGWFPQETAFRTQKTSVPLTSKPKKDNPQKNIAIANGLLLGAFLGVHLLIDPRNESAVVSVGFWVTFVPAVILLNYLMYRRSKSSRGGS